MSLNCDVYLIHYEPLAERLVFMRRQLERLGINVKETISDEPKAGWIKDDPISRKEKLKRFHNHESKSISSAEESLAWKHFLFLKRVSEGERPGLVLEDDAILSDNFVDVVNNILVTKNWDAVFPGSGCNLRSNGRGLIRVQHPASKCTDAYIVTVDAAKKLYSTMSLVDGVSLAIDWELNYQLMINDLKVYWLEPPIVRQGSQDGTFYSSINGKRENLF